MSLDVVLEGVEQVLQREAGLGRAFDRQAPLEEQRVRILLAPRQGDEVAQARAHEHVGIPGRHGHEAPAVDAEREAQRQVRGLQRQRAAVDRVQSFAYRLAAQQMIEQHAGDLSRNGGRKQGRQDGGLERTGHRADSTVVLMHIYTCRAAPALDPGQCGADRGSRGTA